MALKITFHDQPVSVGDTVRISQKVREGEKQRIQQFQGTVIAIKGNHGERTVMVRKVASGGIGVERVFPVEMPSIASVAVLRHAQVRRSKLYFLRDRIGKNAVLLKEQRNESNQPKTAGKSRRGRRPRISPSPTPAAS